MLINATVSPAGGVTLTPTTNETSIVSDGVTFTLDTAMPVGYFVTGEPFIVSTGAFNITNITPVSSNIQGDGYIGNGAMKNPWPPFTGTQGFDGYLGDYPTKTSYQTAYSTAQNIDPAISGNIAISSGEKATVVKSIRDAGKTSTTNQFQTIGKYVPLTILDTAPVVNSYMPAHAGTTKKMRSRADVSFSPRLMALPASFLSVADIIGDVPVNLGLYAAGEQLRFTRVDNALGTTNDGYSAEITPEYSRYVYAMNSSDVSEAQRQAMVDKVITFANQIEELLDLGVSLNWGAGQGGGVWLWGMAASALLNDTTLYNKMRSACQPDTTTIWQTSALVGKATPTSFNRNAQTYFDEHVGTPWSEPEEAGSHHAGRYTNLASNIVTWEYTSLLPFTQGPGAFTSGADMLLDGGVMNETNDLSSGLAFCSKYKTWIPNHSSGSGPSQDFIDAFDDMTATGDFVPWSGKPEQPPMGVVAGQLNDNYFTAGSGSILLDIQGIGYFTEAITQTDLRYSLDYVQWVEVNNITLAGDNYTESGLLHGVNHYAGWRRRSASGIGPWSANYPLDDDTGGDRGLVTTTGTEGNAAPSYTGRTQPQIHYRPYVAWIHPYWSESPATLNVDDVELSVGIGYPSGYPAPTYTYQWKRDGSATGMPTTKNYTRVVDDADTVLTCDVTATNASGSVTVTTAGVTCPPITVLPAGTLIDTDFRGAFAIDYATELSNVTVVQNYNITHEPATLPGDIAAGNTGGLRFEKLASFPNGYMTISKAAAISTIYDFTLEIMIDGDAFSDRGLFQITIEETGGAVLYTKQVDLTGTAQDVLVNVVDQITTASITSLLLRSQHLTSTGGGGGGDTYFTQLTIAEV